MPEIKTRTQTGVEKILKWEAEHVNIKDTANRFEAQNVEEVLIELKNAVQTGGMTESEANEIFATKLELASAIAGIETGGGSIDVTGAKKIFLVNDYKTGSNTWSQAFQAAFDAAYSATVPTISQYPTKTGSQLGLAANATVTAHPGVYELAQTISCPYGVNFDFRDCIVKSTAPVTISDYDAFRMVNNCYHNRFVLPIFVGFRRGFVFATANRDTSLIEIEGGGSLNCKGCIDDIGYLSSRSTMLNIHGFYHVLTDQPFRVHTDICHIHDGWISSSGYNGSAIFSQSRLFVDNVIMIPKPMVGSNGDKACWIECWTETASTDLVVPATGVIEDADPDNAKKGGVGANNRAVKIDFCVFGGESGSMPAVRWYGKTATNLNNSNALHNHIVIQDCSIEVGNTAAVPEKSPVVIHGDLPSLIAFEGLNGLSAASHGLVYMKTNSAVHKQADQKFRYEIYIGPGVNGRNSYPVTNDPLLYEFITAPVFLNRDIPTFTALRTAKKELSQGTGDDPYVPPQPEPEPELPPLADRRNIRYVRIGGVRSGTDTFLPAEIEVMKGDTNLVLGNQTWTVPSGTTRNNVVYPTDGERNHLASTLSNTDHSKLYLTFDLSQGYKDLDSVYVLLYTGLTFENVFVDVSADNTNWYRATLKPTVTVSGYNGFTVTQEQLYNKNATKITYS